MLNMHPDGWEQDISAVSMDGSTVPGIISGSGVQMQTALPLAFCAPQVALTDFD